MLPKLVKNSPANIMGKIGHFQAKYGKRLNDFPQLVQQSNDRVIFQSKPYSY